VATGHEEVVQGFLLGPSLYQLIMSSLLVLHAKQGFVVAVGSVVYLHLLVALLFQGWQSSHEGLTSFNGRLLLPQQSMQVNCWYRPLQRFFPRGVCLCDLSVQLFYLAHYAGHLLLDLLQCALLSLLDAFPDSKDRRKWESKRHR
jgi:hypothetical protein